jgi:hypothetical protein
MSNVLDSIWFNTAQGHFGIILAEDPTTNERRLYAGVCTGSDQKQDEQNILAWGNKVNLILLGQFIERAGRKGPEPVLPEGAETPKLGVFLELDEHGIETGRFVVADEVDEIIEDSFETEEEAETFKVTKQAEYDRNAHIGINYLEWEKACMEHTGISQDDLRSYLCNVILV